MKVLLLVADVYASFGGGQTFYKRVIADNPSIQFTCYYTSDTAPSGVPENVTLVRLGTHPDIVVDSPLPFSAFWRGQFLEALKFASSVKGEAYDIVELPDYYTFGYFVPKAMNEFGVKFQSFVLSLHGNISNTIEHNWGSSGDCTLDHRVLEKKQFERADYRYAISQYYADLWTSRADLPVEVLDPLSFIDFALAEYSPKSEHVKIANIARQERLKGDDLLVEIAAWLDPTKYEEVLHIGQAQTLPDGAMSPYALKVMAERRGVRNSSPGVMNRSQLQEVFSDKTLVCLPTRFDSLNLVALEALGAGCPVAVSTKAGVCQYLDENHPEIEYIKLDTDDLMLSVKRIEDAIDNYDKLRANAKRASELLIKRRKKIDFGEVYTRAVENAKSLVQDIEIEYRTAYLSSLNVGPLVGYLRKNLTNTPVAPLLKPIYRNFYSQSIERELSFVAHSATAQALMAYSRQSEPSLESLRNKLSTLYSLYDQGFPKVNLYTEIARLERLRGNLLNAICYDLRVARLMPEKMPGIVDTIVPELKSLKLDFIADVLTAWSMARKGGGDDLVRHFEDRIAYCKTISTAKVEFEKISDTRLKKKPKVTIIVSLYNAANKMYHFANHVAKTTLFKNGQAEIIFVDSGSPVDEESEVKKIAHLFNNKLLFMRTKERDTIQGAWNVGLGYARGEYVTFLGVDEGVFPLALEKLAEHLDANPEVDWVVGESVLALVDKNGTHKTDAMRFSRRDAHKLSAILDTTYLTYVGGLYRRNVHERFGYYDTRFRAAGDTEFKCRLLGKIGVGYLDTPCGIFYDFPEERATASCIAEIEDSIAWYAFRSPEGINSILSKCSPAEVATLAAEAYGYRKCYQDGHSTDIELARSIKAAQPDSAADANFPAAEQVLDRMVHYDFVANLREANHFDAARSMAEQAHKSWQQANGEGGNTLFMHQDNRYQQHSWLWRSI